jgi:hypothetical protein
MAYEQRDNSGSLFRNDRKEKESHPDRTGSAMVDGVEYWVSGWIKQDRNGNQFMSLAFKPKVAKEQLPMSQQLRRPPPDVQPPMGNAPRGSMKDQTIGRRDMDDEIPF